MNDRIAAILMLLVLAAGAAGHDGGFGHSRRTLFLTAAADGLVLEYRLQHNREDALVEMTLMDADGDGKISVPEKDRFLQERARQLAANILATTPTGEKVALKFDSARLDQGLTQTFRFQLPTAAREVLLEDRNFGHKPGLVQVSNSASVTVTLARPTVLAHAERVALRIQRDPK